MTPYDRLFNLRLPADARAALERAARDDHRSASGYARKVLIEHLRRRRYLGPPPTGGRAAKED